MAATRMTAKAKAELIAKRKAGTTLAELRKAYPQFTTEQIREVLPPLPKATRKAAPAATTAEPTGYSGSGDTSERQLAAGQAKTRKRTVKAPVTTTKAQPADEVKSKRNLKAGQAKTAKQAQPKAPVDPKLAATVVKLRDKDGLSWLRIGAQLKLSDPASPKAAASRARTLYRSVKGADASTGLLAKSS
jgi:hypothetical protein